MTLLSNPYIAGDPVSGQERFIGRTDVLRDVSRALRNPNTNAIVLFGQRRIGKTSVLLHLEKSLAAGSEYIPVYFDLQGKAVLPLVEVLYQLARRIASVVGVVPPARDSFDPAGDFFRDTFLPDVMRRAADNRLVLLFDEFDVLDLLQQGQAGATFFPYLRAWMVEAVRVQFVFVLGRRPDELSTDTLSAFKAVFSCQVSLMNRADSEAIIRQSERNQSLEWHDEGIERVWYWTQGHPFLTQLLCSEVWEAAYEGLERPAAARAAGVDAAIDKALEQGAHAFQWIWKGLSRAERAVMAAMAEVGQENIGQDELNEILDRSGVRFMLRDLDLAPETLLRWGLLRPADGGFRFAIPLLHRWVAANKSLLRVKAELGESESVTKALYRSGEEMYGRGDLTRAEWFLRRVLDSDPHHHRARMTLGQVLLEQRDPAAAVAVLEPAYEFAPPLVRAGLVNALQALAEGRDEAKQLASHLQRDDLDAALEAYRQLGNQAEATRVRTMQREPELAEQAEPDNPELLAENLCRSGESMRELGNLAEAERQLRSALDFNPNHFRARLALGQVLLEQGDSVAAVEMLESAHTFDSPSPPTGPMRAWLAWAETQGEAKQLAAYEQMLAEEPEQPIVLEKKRVIWLQRARATLQRGALEAAEQHKEVADRPAALTYVTLTVAIVATVVVAVGLAFQLGWVSDEWVSKSVSSILGTRLLFYAIGMTVVVVYISDQGGKKCRRTALTVSLALWLAIAIGWWAGEWSGILAITLPSLIVLVAGLLAIPSFALPVNPLPWKWPIALATFYTLLWLTGYWSGWLEMDIVSMLACLQGLLLILRLAVPVEGVKSFVALMLFAAYVFFTLATWRVFDGAKLDSLNLLVLVQGFLVLTCYAVPVLGRNQTETWLTFALSFGLAYLASMPRGIIDVTWTNLAILWLGLAAFLRLALLDQDETGLTDSAADWIIVWAVFSSYALVWGVGLVSGELQVAWLNAGLIAGIGVAAIFMPAFIRPTQGGRAFQALITYNLGRNYPYYAVVGQADEPNRFSQRADGDQSLKLFAGPGIALSNADHAFVISDGTGFMPERVAPPGLTFTDTYEAVTEAVDLRYQLRSRPAILAKTKDGIDVQVITFTPFRLAVERAVAVTPDGRRAITAHHDGILKLWDLGAGLVERSLDGHTDWVRAIAITPDGRRAVSASSDNTLKVWNLDTGQAEHTFDGYARVRAAAVTAGARRLVLGYSDGTLKVWELGGGRERVLREVQPLVGHRDWVYAVAATPDGQRAVSASSDGALKVWNLRLGLEVATLDEHDEWILAVAMMSDGHYAVSASSDGRLKVWDMYKGWQEPTLAGRQRGVRAVAVPGDDEVITLSSDGNIKTWDLSTGEEKSSRKGPEGWKRAVSNPMPQLGRSFPYDEEAILKAVHAQQMEKREHSERSGWDALLRQRCESVMRDIIAEYTMDELCSLDDLDRDPRVEIATRMRDEVRAQIRKWGMELIGGGISNLNPPEEVIRQRVERWQTRSQKRGVVSETQVETEGKRKTENAQVGPQDSQSASKIRVPYDSEEPTSQGKSVVRGEMTAESVSEGRIGQAALRRIARKRGIPTPPKDEDACQKQRQALVNAFFLILLALSIALELRDRGLNLVDVSSGLRDGVVAFFDPDTPSPSIDGADLVLSVIIVIRNMIPPSLMLVLALWFGARFMQAVHGMPNTKEANHYLRTCLFGPIGGGPSLPAALAMDLAVEGVLGEALMRGPYIVSRGGEVVFTTVSTQVERVGGPGSIMVINDSAVLLERAGQLTRVVGPGSTPLARFEKVRDVINLRPQKYATFKDHATFRVGGMSREGIPVVWPVDVYYQINDDGEGRHEATPGRPYAFSDEAVLRASTDRWLRGSEGHDHLEWGDRIVVSDADGALRNIMARLPLDRLIRPLDDEPFPPRRQIQQELEAVLKRSAARHGAKVLRVDLHNIEFWDPVAQRLIDAWGASSESL